MERIIWTHQSPQPFYVFDARDVVHFWDDGVSIHRAAPWYKDAGTRLSPFEGPHVYPRALPLAFYKNAVLQNRLPISVVVDGENLGTVKQTADYGFGSVEPGAHKQRIVKQHTSLAVSDGCLVVQLRIEAAPVATARTGGAGGEPYGYAFVFRFPLDVVPELLNLTAGEARLFGSVTASVRC